MSMRHPAMQELLTGSVGRAGFVSVPAQRPDRPVIAMSRQMGARGGEVAAALGRELGLRVYDREIIHDIARSCRVCEPAVSLLDEKPRRLLSDWLGSIQADAYLSPYAYIENLARVIRAAAGAGNAIILGRGSHLILGPSQALRVLVVAPYEARLRQVAEREAIGAREAARRIAETDEGRRAFLARYFRAATSDPSLFDLVVNTAVLGVDGAAEAIRAALPRRARSAAGRA